MKVKTVQVRKPSNVKELRLRTTSEYVKDAVWYNVSQVIELDTPDYNWFRQHLLSDHDWLEGVFDPNGLVVVKSKSGEEMIAVDTQGYNYARYAGLVLEVR